MSFSARTLCVLKDKISRQILDDLDAAKIGIASSTYDVVGFPPIRVEGPVRIEGGLSGDQKL